MVAREGTPNMRNSLSAGLPGEGSHPLSNHEPPYHGFVGIEHGCRERPEIHLEEPNMEGFAPKTK